MHHKNFNVAEDSLFCVDTEMVSFLKHITFIREDLSRIMRWDSYPQIISGVCSSMRAFLKIAY